MRRVAAELLDYQPSRRMPECAKNNRCELQRVAAHVGIDAQRLARTETAGENAAGGRFQSVLQL